MRVRTNENSFSQSGETSKLASSVGLFYFSSGFCLRPVTHGFTEEVGENPKTDCKFSAVPVFLFSLIIFAYARKFFSAMHSLSLQ